MGSIANLNSTLATLVFAILVCTVHSLSQSSGSFPTPSLAQSTPTRRAFLYGAALGSSLGIAAAPAAWAAADCMSDCFKNCKSIAPKDAAYCKDTCQDYCAQSDRTDGLSGSVSAESGEVGILGGAFGTGTVVKGDDKPPVLNLPGLDFTSDKGRKLLGY